MYYRIGEVHLLQSRNDEAIASLEKARSANLELAYVHAFLASAYSLEGETELAAPSSAQLVSSEMVIQASPNRLPDFLGVEDPFLVRSHLFRRSARVRHAGGLTDTVLETKAVA
jgi:hypothetical protein